VCVCVKHTQTVVFECACEVYVNDHVFVCVIHSNGHVFVCACVKFTQTVMCLCVMRASSGPQVCFLTSHRKWVCACSQTQASLSEAAAKDGGCCKAVGIEWMSAADLSHRGIACKMVPVHLLLHTLHILLHSCLLSAPPPVRRSCILTGVCGWVC